MPTITDLVLDKQYSDLQVLTEAILDAACDSIVTYVNVLKDDFLSVTKDSLGADYTYPASGNAAYTNSLYEKQFVSTGYSGLSDISIGTSADVAYGAVDALNAAISITPERTGHYRAVFVFTHSIQLNATSEGECYTTFRITDGTSASLSVGSGFYSPAPAANNVRQSNPITITKIFNWTDTSTKTIQLQKFVRVATNVNVQYVRANPLYGEITMLVEKI